MHKTGTLPTISDNPILENAIPVEMKSQLDLLDNENYYEVDLSKAGNISIKDTRREYIVNEQTLRVYCRKPLSYEGENYYTVTNSLMGIESDYEEQNEELTIVGNPISWSPRGRLRLVIPRKALDAKKDGETTEDFWNKWEFKWDFGPKTIANIKESATAKTFSYGDTLVVKSNGVYTVYVKNSNEEETILNVVVTKVDDIFPKYAINGGKIDIVDDETGIAGIYYKTKEQYLENKEYAESINEGEAEGRDELDFYLLNGKGSNLIEDMPLDVKEYNANYLTIKERRESEIARFNALSAEDQALTQEEHNNYLNEYDEAERALKAQYPYLADPNAVTDKGALVIFVEDEAGNAIVIGEGEEIVSFDILTKTYNLGEVHD